MTLAILSLEGTIPVSKDLLKICLSGDKMTGATFLRRKVESPDISGVFLSSKFSIHAVI
jgi:hypothetical protein